MEPRPAEPADVAALDALARAVGLSLDAASELSRGHAELWVVGASGEPVGFALGWFLADELEIVDVAVAAAARLQGHGLRLLEKLLARGRERGARAAFLEVRASNAPAQALYRSSGFEKDGERSRYYADGEDAWLFRCCLEAGQHPDSTR